MNEDDDITGLGKFIVERFRRETAAILHSQYANEEFCKLKQCYGCLLLNNCPKQKEEIKCDKLISCDIIDI